MSSKANQVPRKCPVVSNTHVVVLIVWQLLSALMSLWQASRMEPFQWHRQEIRLTKGRLYFPNGVQILLKFIIFCQGEVNFPRYKSVHHCIFKVNRLANIHF